MRGTALAKLSLYGACGLVTILTFLNGLYLPPSVAAPAFFIIAIVGMAVIGGTPLGLLPRLYLTLYVAPFTVCLLYVRNSTNVWAVDPAGVGAVYQSDPVLIGILIATGMAGLFGLLFGFELPGLVPPRAGVRASAAKDEPLPLTLVIPVVLMATWLSWLGSPSKTIFEAAYAQEGTDPRSFGMNFAGAVLVSYGLFMMVAIDLEREPRGSGRRRAKQALLLASVTYIVIFLQLFRGDRDSIGLLAGLAVLFLTSGTARWSLRAAVRRSLAIIVPAILLFMMFVTVGAARYMTTFTPEERTPRVLVERGLQWNTWTSVLVTNLGAAAEYRHGTISFFHGKTYLDYALSLPPGFVSAMVGYERPVDLSRGPNWWYAGLASGGMHAAVVPFKNFSVVGPFVFMALYGCFVGFVEQRNRSDRYWSRLTYAMTATVAFLWFWFGDMNIVRALMVVVVVGTLDRLAGILSGIRRNREQGAE